MCFAVVSLCGAYACVANHLRGLLLLLVERERRELLLLRRFVLCRLWCLLCLLCRLLLLLLLLLRLLLGLCRERLCLRLLLLLLLWLLLLSWRLLLRLRLVLRLFLLLLLRLLLGLRLLLRERDELKRRRLPPLRRDGAGGLGQSHALWPGWLQLKHMMACGQRARSILSFSPLNSGGFAAAQPANKQCESRPLGTLRCGGVGTNQ